MCVFEFECVCVWCYFVVPLLNDGMPVRRLMLQINRRIRQIGGRRRIKHGLMLLVQVGVVIATATVKRSGSVAVAYYADDIIVLFSTIGRYGRTIRAVRAA